MGQARASPNALQDVKLYARVGRTGELLARALRDPGSVNLYRALLWGALRAAGRPPAGEQAVGLLLEGPVYRVA